MFSRFFIDRPIFASVLSLLIVLGGFLALGTLPLAQFPPVTPPTVTVSCNYPGASATDVAGAVAAPIEQQVNGVEGMMYMSSSCTNDGSYNLTVTFHHGVNLDMAQVMVQNRVALALPLLPDVIKQTGVTTRKRSPDILGGFAIYSSDGRYDQVYLSNYCLRALKDELARVDGVGDVFLFGQRDYAMRIWVDPDKLAARGLSATDVVRAIRSQNVDVATGQIGQQPAPPGQEQQITLDTLGRLVEPEQFADIVLKATPDGRLVRVKDVGRVELGARNADVMARMDGRETAFLAIFQLPDANALDTRQRVADKMAELSRDFPEGIEYDMAFDTTPYTRESIYEVFYTLRDAILLVALVVLVFLQNWRSALIPLIAVPVAIVGTFAAMAALGFSLNNLTLFGLVLAIGIVVDDAIVVVEAVEHHIERGLAPREATIRAMEQVSGPVVAVGVVLSAVFIPCMFIGGITGQFFKQFALTISVSTLISAFNSLTLSPALTALLLRPRDKQTASPLPWLAFVAAGGWFGWEALGRFRHALEHAGHRPAERWSTWERWAAQLAALPGAAAVPDGLAPVLAVAAGALAGLLLAWPANLLLRGAFRGFNAAFGLATTAYARAVGGMVRASALVLVAYGGLLVLTLYGFVSAPKGFIPSQDMGYLMVTVQLPDAASLERTDAVMRQLEELTYPDPKNPHDPRHGIRHRTAISGQSFALNAYGSNFGSMFINLKDYGERREPHLSSMAILMALQQQFNTQVYDAQVNIFPPPPVRGVGRAGGFAIMIEDRGDLGPHVLQRYAEEVMRRGNQTPLAAFRGPHPWQTAEELDHVIAELQKEAAAEAQANPDKAGAASGKGPGGPAASPKLAPGMIGLFSVFRANVPQVHVEPDRRECLAKGVPLGEFSSTLSVYQGSLYVNDFNLLGRTYQVVVQADPEHRRRMEQVKLLRARSTTGQMVPLGSLARIKEINGPLVLNRYNTHPAASVNGLTLPGVSSGDGMDMMERLCDATLPPGMAYEWTDMSYLELQAGNTATVIFGCAVIAVFLALAALYESWSLPLAVILVVPMCLLSALAGVLIARMDVNIFTRIGFVVLVGLACKNAILIVEFAKRRREAGASRREATLAACKLRLRPIIMTSFAFILGALPLILATGAGAEMRATLGTAVFSGMLGVTLFGIFLTPVFFYVIDWLGESSFLRSPAVQVISYVLLVVLTLGLAFVIAAALRELRRARRSDVNGQG